MPRSIDAISYQDGPPRPPHIKKPRRKLWLFLLFVSLTLVAVGWGTTELLSKTNRIFSNKENPLVRFGRLLIGSDRELIGENRGRVNVLLLGMGGEGHDGPLLTDTIIVLEIDTKTEEAVLVSLPRDFVVGLPQAGFRKINSAYAFAETAEAGKGGGATIDAVEKITGFEIPYFAAIDFEGFVEAVDHIGGLDIYVERSFTDATYPDKTYGYLPPVSFKVGLEHMDGERALQFARSRHGNNGEGSDFARSERQKKIISAFVQKIVKLNLTDLKTINNLLGDFTENFQTNLEPHELKRLAEIGKKIKPEKTYSFSLEPDDQLICQGIIEDYTSRAYVIQPCEGVTYPDIHEQLNNVFAAAKLKKEDAAVEIQNSTGKAYALENLNELIKLVPKTKVTSFNSRVPYERTILYDNSNGKFPNTADYLKNNFNFTLADVPYTNSTADFVIILGRDAL
ncbi:MAG: LCP family protein [Candidatus Doudnabacteria bacterium]|nr:LCP family protein [Candidatus Doudnabacteria bacterium]